MVKNGILKLVMCNNTHILPKERCAIVGDKANEVKKYYFTLLVADLWWFRIANS